MSSKAKTPRPAKAYRFISSTAFFWSILPWPPATCHIPQTSQQDTNPWIIKEENSSFYDVEWNLNTIIQEGEEGARDFQVALISWENFQQGEERERTCDNRRNWKASNWAKGNGAAVVGHDGGRRHLRAPMIFLKFRHIQFFLNHFTFRFNTEWLLLSPIVLSLPLWSRNVVKKQQIIPSLHY
jgi:hypothetical protein